MVQKYEILDETLNHEGRILHRIRRIKDGEIGGWIEKEKNLSHDGKCWISKNAKVYDDARVLQNSTVTGDAEVFGSARLLNSAKVTDFAKVKGSAVISGKAVILGEASIYSRARVLEDAKVGGQAIIRGNAQIKGEAKIKDNVRVLGNVSVSGNAKIYGNARLKDDVVVDEFARIYGNARIFDNARISGHAQIYEDAYVFDYALVYGTAKIHGDVQLQGNAMVYENMELDTGIIKGNPGDQGVITQLQVILANVDRSSKLKIYPSYAEGLELLSNGDPLSFFNGEQISIITYPRPGRANNLLPSQTLVTIQKDFEDLVPIFVWKINISGERGSRLRREFRLTNMEELKKAYHNTIQILSENPDFYMYEDEF